MNFPFEDVLVSLVDEFLEPFGCTAEFSNDFSYCPEDNEITFTILYSERADRLFREYIKSHFSFEVPNLFMMSLLHEVGHAMTLFTFSKTEMENAHHAKELIENDLKEEDTDETFSKYFDLDIEKVATEWAVNYYRSNSEKIEDFYLKFEKTLHQAFTELELTE